MSNSNIFPDYKLFINKFINKGYEIQPLEKKKLEKSGVIYLRHDIDFDCELALKMANEEAKIGVKATYFFMSSSDGYNLYSKKNRECVKEIKRLGHKISLHFDPSIYNNISVNLRKEVSIFYDFFATKIGLVSIHRPSEAFINCKDKIGGVDHTYQPQFTRDVTYIADSRGRFRYGAPQESDAFLNRESIHLLIHPIWWTVQGAGSQEVLDAYLIRRTRQFQKHIESNCLSYKSKKSIVNISL